jgi:hypothetical protein
MQTAQRLEKDRLAECGMPHRDRNFVRHSHICCPRSVYPSPSSVVEGRWVDIQYPACSIIRSIEPLGGQALTSKQTRISTWRLAVVLLPARLRVASKTSQLLSLCSAQSSVKNTPHKPLSVRGSHTDVYLWHSQCCQSRFQNPPVQLFHSTTEVRWCQNPG